MSDFPVVVSDPLLSFSAEVAVKSTLVLVVAAITGRLLRKAHPAARHRAWALGLVLAAAIPLLVVSLPGLHLPSSVVAWVRASPAKLATATKPAAENPQLAFGPGTKSIGDGLAKRSSIAPSSDLPAAASAVEPRRIATWVTLAVILVVAWTLGSIALLGRIAMSLLRAKAVARRGRPLALPELNEAIEELGISRPVRLLESDDVKVPMTGGMIHPVLIVPAGFAGWTAECRRLVLLHELAHVRRGDFLLNLVCEVALALHWIQPLAWFAARRVREEAEVAADDVVIGTGAVPSTYASHLLSIVQGLPGTGGGRLLTVAMGATPIERRLKTILAPGRKLGGWRGRPTIPILAVVLTGILAATRLAATPVERQKGVKTASETAERLAAATEPTSGESADELAAVLARAVRAATARVKNYVVVAHNTAWNHFHAHAHSRAKKEVSAGAHEGGGGSDDSDRGESAFERAQELHQAGDYQHAIDAWHEAIRLGDREGTASYNLACSEARLGESERALDALQRAIDAGFDAGEYLERDRDLVSLRSDSRFRKLREEYGGGDRERAIARLEHLEYASPQDFDSWYGLGQELHALGEYDAAIRAWRKSLEVEPGNSSATYNIACAEALKGDSNSSLRDLDRAIGLGFASAEHLEQDEDLESLRGSERYQELVETARELELPDGAGSWMSGAPDPKVWREAKLRYERQIELHSDSGRAWFNLGFARLRLGEPAGAVEAFRTAFEKGYRPGPTAYNVACSYAAMNERDRAFEWLDGARDAGFDVEGMVAGDPDLESLREDPRFPKVRRDLVKMKREKQQIERRAQEREQRVEEF